jgi:cell division protein FtsN
MAKTVIFLLSLLLVACSSSSETTSEAEESDSQEVYVFDDMTEENEAEIKEVEAPAQIESQKSIEEPVDQPVEIMEKIVDLYLVQVGAFTTEARALRFIEENKDILNYEMTSHYSEDVKLYVVQLPPFRTREKAEEVRNELRSLGKYNDAFIVPK